MKKMITIFRTAIAMVIIAVLMLSSIVPTANAAKISDLSQLNEARVSFTFDDGFRSTYTLAAPILRNNNIKGTAYITSGIIDKTIPLDDNLPPMTWAQVASLQKDYGWEIGAHTATHAELPTLTPAEIATQLDASNQAFAQHGITVTNFATPYGAYDNVVITEAMKRYNSHRGFFDRDTMNTNPADRAVLRVQSVQEGVSTTTIRKWIDDAIAKKQWLVLVFHDVAYFRNPNYEYTTTTSQLTSIAQYVYSKRSQIKAVTIEQGTTVPGTNVLQNASFADGFTGWSTDNAAQVTLDTNNNGNFPSPKDSVKLTGGATAAHLFSNFTPVTTATSFIVDVFVNATNLTSGELGFFADEYDAAGNWISGQWLGSVTNGTVGFFTKLYNATSNLVSSIKLQTYLTAGSQGTAYIDNANVRALDPMPSTVPTVIPTGTVAPTPTVVPTTPVTPTPINTPNLVQNGSFDNGLADGWTTDNAAQVVAENQAISMNGSSRSSHLFYSLSGIDTSARYRFQSVANTTGVTSGELGYYIDEYDASGTWISGQWLGDVVNGTTTTFTKEYRATSNNVARIRLQTYLNANTTGKAVVDNYVFSLIPATPTTTPATTVTPGAQPTITPTPIQAGPTPTPTPTPTNSWTNLFSWLWGR